MQTLENLSHLFSHPEPIQNKSDLSTPRNTQRRNLQPAVWKRPYTASTCWHWYDQLYLRVIDSNRPKPNNPTRFTNNDTNHPERPFRVDWRPAVLVSRPINRLSRKCFCTDSCRDTRRCLADMATLSRWCHKTKLALTLPCQRRCSKTIWQEKVHFCRFARQCCL